VFRASLTMPPPDEAVVKAPLLEIRLALLVFVRLAI
jgi:hypothetical protein